MIRALSRALLSPFAGARARTERATKRAGSRRSFLRAPHLARDRPRSAVPRSEAHAEDRRHRLPGRPGSLFASGLRRGAAGSRAARLQHLRGRDRRGPRGPRGARHAAGGEFDLWPGGGHPSPAAGFRATYHRRAFPAGAHQSACAPRGPARGRPLGDEPHRAARPVPGLPAPPRHRAAGRGRHGGLRSGCGGDGRPDARGARLRARRRDLRARHAGAPHRGPVEQHDAFPDHVPRAAAGPAGRRDHHRTSPRRSTRRSAASRRTAST